MSLKDLQANSTTEVQQPTIADKQDKIIERIGELNEVQSSIPRSLVLNQSTAGIQIGSVESLTINQTHITAAPQGGDFSYGFRTYLKNLKGKSNTIKTLLYSNEPRPFREFYVCNSIERRIPAKKRNARYTYTVEIIRDATATRLSDISNFIIVSGTGGLGKSMLMRHLLLDAIDNFGESGVIPVFVELKDFDAHNNDFYDYIFSKVTHYSDDISTEAFRNSLKSGRCLLLFDGLDEMNGTVEKAFVNRLEEFTDKYPDNTFVISSRPAEFTQFQRFTVLRLQPFTKEQALELVDKLEFRSDEPTIKEKFRNLLNNTLWRTHAAFTENPLLLTIMLMTFEQNAEVPTQMHIFYQEAFSALAVKHDARKGAYKRALKSGLTVERLTTYFAEFCFRSYHDEKFELTELEFADYYYALSSRRNAEDNASNADDYLRDLTVNVCVMYQESGKYHFIHRSFQEYFCAVFLSRQTDVFIGKSRVFFEKRYSRWRSDNTFAMLYAMAQEKVEKFIFIPFLDELLLFCDENDGYWTFLDNQYPHFYYYDGETSDYSSVSCKSGIYRFIAELINPKYAIEHMRLKDLPVDEDLEYMEYINCVTSVDLDDEHDRDEDNWEIVSRDEVDEWWYEYTERKYGQPDTEGTRYSVDVGQLLIDAEEQELHQELVEALDENGFVLKKEYNAARYYLGHLKAKHKKNDDSLLELLN